jgi:hypothetical protein
LKQDNDILSKRCNEERKSGEEARQAVYLRRMVALFGFELLLLLLP